MRADGLYNIGLIVDGGIREKGKADAVAEWFAHESSLPIQDIATLDDSDTGPLR